MTHAGDLNKILVIRRDNIGDLVCTTPLLRALRAQLPAARIEVLATRYNQAVLHGNPDIDALHFYVKAKHRLPGESVLGIYWRRLCMLASLRRRRFDVVVIAGGASASALRLARSIRPGRIVVQQADELSSGGNEVENCCRLLLPLGLAYATPAPRVVADTRLAEALRAQCQLEVGREVIGIHISARKPSQRWPASQFAELIAALHQEQPQRRFILLWAPGSENNPLHPGDDEKAAAVLALTRGLPIAPVATSRLEELIAALSLCQRVICADGGAMHLAAGLGKPMVCFFGQSDAQRWHPWGVPYQLLQPASQEVKDLSVAQVLAAWQQLSG